MALSVSWKVSAQAQSLHSPLDPMIPLGQPTLKTQSDWENGRAALQERFLQEIYGHLPQSPAVSGHLHSQGPLAKLPGFFQEHVIELNWQGKRLRRLHLLILRPQQSQPTALLFLNKCGNASLLKDPVLPRYLPLYPDLCPGEMSERGWQQDYWDVASALAAGLTLITLHETELAPDAPAAFAETVSAWPEILFRSGPRPGLIAIWAWGLQSVRSYLATLPEFQGSQIGLLGHSRRGKAALLATALDGRFAFVVAHQTGTLGAAPLRLHPAESLASITFFFPHWFTPSLAQKQVADLSVDQHQLLALVAPKPLLITEGARDFWASPDLSLAALNAALPVYQLYFPNLPSQLHSWQPGQELAALQRPVAHVLTGDGHTLNRGYWQAILAFLQGQGLLKKHFP
ncbi:MAG: hypothetical protein IV090_01105 [Candidatus Sericytochromatia bacterium]|nr:hypothetical protein [Candidatus Sericytochromatia bacterium]